MNASKDEHDASRIMRYGRVLRKCLLRLLGTRSSVFVSHSSEDDRYVNALTKVFEDQRIKIFVDHDRAHGIAPSEKWEQRLQDELAGCEAVVLCITPAWLKSTWCRAEYNTTRLMKKPIIPIVFENCDHKDIAPDTQKLDIIGKASTELAPAIAIVIKRLPRRHKALILAVPAAGLLIAIAGLAIKPSEFGRWSRAGPYGGALVSFAVEGSTVYAGATTIGDMAGGLFRSDDCGHHWHALPVPPKVSSVNSVELQQDYLRIATDHGLWSTAAADINWIRADLKTENDDFAVWVASPLNPEIRVSLTPIRGGALFSAGVAGSAGVSPSLDSSSGGVHVQRPKDDRLWTFPITVANDVAFSPTNSLLAYVVSAGDGIWITRDGFESLERINSFPGNGAVKANFSPDGKLLFVGTIKNGLWIYDTASGAWRDIEQLRGLQVVKTFVDERKPDQMLIGTSKGLFVAALDGRSVVKASDAPPTEHINVFAGCGDDILVGTGGAGVSRRRFNQEDWVDSSTGLTMAPVRSMILRDNLQLISTGVGLYRSFDDGSTFQFVRNSPGGILVLNAIEWPEPPSNGIRPGVQRSAPNGVGMDAAIESYRNAILLGGDWNGRIWRKADGSNDWKRVWPEAAAQTPEDPDDATNQIWSLVSSRTIPGLVFATMKSSLLRSTDYGATWEKMNEQGLPTDIVMAFRGSKGQLLLSTRENKIGLLDLTTGEFKQSKGIESDSFDVVSDVVAGPVTDSMLAISLAGRVYASGDGGRSFNLVGMVPISEAGEKSQNHLSLLAFSQQDHWMAGTSVGPFASRDDGKTWVRIPLGGREREVQISTITSEPFGSSIAMATNVGLLRKQKMTVWCVTDNKCFTWSLAAIPANLAGYFETARRRVARVFH